MNLGGKNMEKSEKKSRGWERKEILIAVLIGVLVLTAGMQTVQLTGMARAEVIVPTSTGAAPAPSSGAAPSVPTNLQNLPSMVGGC